jgi:hypothetical protein
MPFLRSQLARHWRSFKTAAVELRDYRNNQKLAQLTNRHAGQRAVIIGMGPSLKTEDLDRLQGVVTFACNKIYLAFEKTEWRPTYYSVCDILVAQNNREKILATDFGGAVPLHNAVTKKLLAVQAGALFYKYNGSIVEWQPGQAAVMPANIGKGILTGGYSVVIEQIQLAYAMGCSEVYVIGVDFHFSGGNRVNQNCISGEVLKSEGEVNHFHPDYRKPGETWTVPRLAEQEHAFKFCRAALERSGRKLYNASRQTALTVVERVSFDEVFPEGAAKG